MANNRTADNLKDAAENAREDLQELGREIYHRADTARRDIIKRLYEVADDVRAEARQTGGEARETADRIAKNLEQTASKLNSRAVDQLEDAAETARTNLWQTLIVSFIVGLIIGVLLSQGDDK
ncbi:MAG: hypothetical protein OHK0046_35450 [Anaerolineae bacterium]